MTGPVSVEQTGRVALVRIANPPVNALSASVIEGLSRAFETLAPDENVDAIVIFGDGDNFVAGADIAEFNQPDYDVVKVGSVFSLIEDMTKPVVAALQGVALGGGLELALACHYRLARPGTKLGLPEVTLGILPGAGGTQRLPRVIGMEPAARMILSGKAVTAEEAVGLGLVDALAPEGLLEFAVAFAAKLGTLPLPRTRDRTVDGPVSSIPTETPGRSSPSFNRPRIVECLLAATSLPFDQAIRLEQRLFEECRLSPESAALRHVFFAERQVAKLPGVADGGPLRSIRRVGVVGAGTMGGGVAMNFLNAGMPVTLIEASAEALDRGLGIISGNYQATVAKGRLQQEAMAERMALLDRSLEYSALSECDLVIEAVFENLELKKSVCRKLGEICKPGAIIATNTSTLDVDSLAEASGRPAEFLGMHFFSPANVMRLLEIVRGAETAPDVLRTILRLARTIRKMPVVSGVCYGFIGNRMLEGYLREADFLMMEGASPDQIDAAIQSLGLPMGPCRMIDLAGCDVAAKVVIEREKAGGLPPDPSYRAVIRKLFEAGRFGQKTSAGYYRYEGRSARHDPEFEQLSAKLAETFGIARRSDISAEEIIERCLAPIVNEGAKILEEGISYRPGDIDIVWINGYAFPDYRGGPMHMADTMGAGAIVETLARHAARHGDAFGYWTPAPLLQRMAREGHRFADWPF